MQYNDLPKDPFMLLSFINTQLRDNYPSLAELSHAFHIEQKSIIDSLSHIDYIYDAIKNQFI